MPLTALSSPSTCSKLLSLSQAMPVCTIFGFSCSFHPHSHRDRAPPPPLWTFLVFQEPGPQGWLCFSSSRDVVRPTAPQGTVGDSSCPVPHAVCAASIPLLQSRDIPAGSMTLGQAGIILFQSGVLNPVKASPHLSVSQLCWGLQPWCLTALPGQGLSASFSCQNVPKCCLAPAPQHASKSMVEWLPMRASGTGCPQCDPSATPLSS